MKAAQLSKGLETGAFFAPKLLNTPSQKKNRTTPRSLRAAPSDGQKLFAFRGGGLQFLARGNGKEPFN